MNERVVLTGATGFVGKQVLKSLIQRGAVVRVVLRPGRSPPVGVADTVETEDVFAEDPAWWAKTCRSMDRLVHVAWPVMHGTYLHSPNNMDALIGTLRMAQGASQAGITRIVGIGTCAEYGLVAHPMDTETSLRPSTAYGAAKAATYLALAKFLPIMGVSFAWCRLFYLFGENEDARRFVPYLHTCLASGKPVNLGSGDAVRDYLDVAEAGEHIAVVALSNIAGAINICSGQPITIRELAEGIADQYGRKDLLRFGARPSSPDDPAYVVGIPTPLPA
jgi:dTDP-6-deoxy-L-talose 4-dehydrogenase (NAD+)